MGTLTHSLPEESDIFFQRQYDGINIAEYLKVEGGDPFYRSMAERSEPLLSFQRKGPGEYTQSFKVFFVTKKYPLDFNKEYAHEDGIGTKCLSTAEIVGGKNG